MPIPYILYTSYSILDYGIAPVLMIITPASINALNTIANPMMVIKNGLMIDSIRIIRPLPENLFRSDEPLTIRIPMTIRTLASPRLKAPIKARPQAIFLIDTARSNITIAVGQGTMPPLMPSPRI